MSQWSLLIGVLMPALVAVVNQPHWPKWVRGMVPVVSSIILGLVQTAAAGHLDWAHLVTTVGLVFAAAMGAYHAWWKPTGLVATIEAATTVGR